jgi:hypothetical protein
MEKKASGTVRSVDYRLVEIWVIWCGGVVWRAVGGGQRLSGRQRVTCGKAPAGPRVGLGRAVSLILTGIGHAQTVVPGSCNLEGGDWQGGSRCRGASAWT